MFSWAYATIAYADNGVTVKTFIYKVSYYFLNPLIKLGFVIALLYFLWGVIEYIYDRNAGHIWQTSVFNDKGAQTTQGADRILYGLIGLLIMVSAFGIISLLQTVLGVTPPTQ